MDIDTKYENDRLLIYLSGELDHHAARPMVSEIIGKIEAYLPRECVLDMGRLTFMDSSGIAVILKAYRCVKELGGRLCIENVQTQPMKVIDASGLERMIKITASVKE